MAKRPPEWELDMMYDVAKRWDISEEEAEVFLEQIDAFGPKSEWPEDTSEKVDVS